MSVNAQSMRLYHCFAKAVYSLSKIRTANCPSVRSSVLPCLVRHLTVIMTAGYDLVLDMERECSFCIRISYKIMKIGILCETQLSAEDRSFSSRIWTSTEKYYFLNDNQM